MISYVLLLHISLPYQDFSKEYFHPDLSSKPWVPVPPYRLPVLYSVRNQPRQSIEPTQHDLLSTLATKELFYYPKTRRLLPTQLFSIPNIVCSILYSFSDKEHTKKPKNLKVHIFLENPSNESFFLSHQVIQNQEPARSIALLLTYYTNQRFGFSFRIQGSCLPKLLSPW